MSTLAQLHSAGTSVWLDDLSRDRLDSGNLSQLIAETGILGVTTNPSIFQAAMTTGSAYDAQLAQLGSRGLSADDAVYELAIQDVQRACDAFAETHRKTNGEDGWVSIEVDPRLARDADATLAQAKTLRDRIDRDNIMIKIPATEEALPAITATLAAGISVNVTLIFSEVRYRAVMDAFAAGLQQAATQGHNVSAIRSVASFFVSRVDAEIDGRLEAIGTPTALELRGKAAIANARLAYAAFEDFFATHELPAGAHVQRPLWASTSVKNPNYPADMYVVELIGPRTVNTMPEQTLRATLDTASTPENSLQGKAEESREVFAALHECGIDFEDVFAKLENEGIEKFEASWRDLLSSVAQRLN
ncbi:transaldolase [Corynebacterium epidermidicanis]|uniref:Transaldolase n=1 Tax=Corynebacterium epidermidicanis TaxID=1050174 RepID=A0A0G3GRL6_9CORY|nr:transaldolase [Corynebacterium epidermidicanis]AKK03205.1 transaldolase [Corynebacterium epidermidicanis]